MVGRSGLMVKAWSAVAGLDGLAQGHRPARARWVFLVPGSLPKGLDLCQAPYQKGWTLLLPGSLTRGLDLLWCHPARAPAPPPPSPPLKTPSPSAPTSATNDRKQPIPLYGVRLPASFSSSSSTQGPGNSLRHCPPLHKLAGSQVTACSTRNMAATDRLTLYLK